MLVKDKLLIPEHKIQSRLKELAKEIDRDYTGKTPIIICSLKGAFIVTADLVRSMKTDVLIDFAGYSSYKGTSSTGNIEETFSVKEYIKGKDVIIAEDIIETGLTIKTMLTQIKKHSPASVKVFTLLYKPNKHSDIKPDYTAFEISDDFVVGYGLDLDGRFRNLRDIWTVKDEEQQ